MKPTIALVGSWADSINDRRAIAAELAAAWPRDTARISVFADTSPAIRDRVNTHGAMCWPEGAFGRHFHRPDFDHALVMIGPRLDSLLALARSSDEGCHVWLQHDVIDADELPIDAPDGWFADVIGSARSVIVGSDWLAGQVRRVSPDGPPVLVLPPAHPTVEPIIETPGRTLVVVGGDEPVHRYLADALTAEVVRLDDPSMTPDERRTRLLSARAALEVRRTERGFASTTVTHMMARGIPTITTLGAHAPFASSSLSESGLVTVAIDDHDELVVRLVEHFRPLFDDDRSWLAASTAAKATAASWTWTDAADVLAQWFTVVDDLAPSSVRVVGAVAS